MTRVQISENDGLLATIKISDPFFDLDLALVKMIPLADRSYNEESHLWTVRNPEKYGDLLPEIGIAIKNYKMQLRLW